MARVLGASVAAVSPLGGPAGARVAELVRRAGVPLRQVDIAESTRESFTVDEFSTGRQYRFVLRGPHLDFSERAQCLRELRGAAGSAEFVVASGSLPPGVPSDFYQLVADVCWELGALLILDTSGAGLAGVARGVFLLKPSLRELRDYVGRPLETEIEQVAAARELIERGVTQAVVVSLGADGALLVTPTVSHRFAAVPMRGVSGVGAGDAMVAGITVGLSRAWSLSESTQLGIAAGTAMLATPGTANPNPCRDRANLRTGRSASRRSPHPLRTTPPVVEDQIPWLTTSPSIASTPDHAGANCVHPGGGGPRAHDVEGQRSPCGARSAVDAFRQR